MYDIDQDVLSSIIETIAHHLYEQERQRCVCVCLSTNCIINHFQMTHLQFSVGTGAAAKVQSVGVDNSERQIQVKTLQGGYIEAQLAEGITLQCTTTITTMW